MEIDKKSIAFLIDELITTDIKCWFAQEAVMKETDPVKIAEAAKLAQTTNARRNALMRAIDERLGEGAISQLGKSYAP
jgi:hypothetical protein